MSTHLPSPSSPSTEGGFPDLLQQALAALDIPSEQGFHVPGGKHRVDLYLPRLPRAAVEFKAAATPKALAAALRQAERTHKLLQEDFGATFRTFLVVLRPPGDEPEALPELADGLKCLFVPGTTPSKEVAAAAAAELKTALDSERTLTFGLAMAGTVGMALLSGTSSALVAVSGLGIIAAAGAALYRAYLSSDEEEKALPSPTAGPQKIFEQPLPQRAAPSPLAHPPAPEVVGELATQTETILRTFFDLAPESHPVLAHEMLFLMEEFRQGHFTACALRAGRSLEFIVYELSRRWNVEIQDATSGLLQELQSRLDRLGDLVGDYQISDGAQKQKLERDIQTTLGELSSKTTAFAFVLKDQQNGMEPKGELAPRTVATLLKKIRKRYGHLDGVAKALNSLLDKDTETPGGNLLLRVLRIRNQAAHADVNGNHRETDEASVKTLLEDINVVIFRLSNVGSAIQAAKVKQGQDNPRQA